MNKLSILFLVFSGYCSCLLGSTYHYRLLPTTQSNYVVVEETIYETSDGYGSNGSFVFNKIKKRERTLTLQEAFDVGVRHQCQPVLGEAVKKMGKKGETVDIADALDIVLDGLKEVRFNRTVSYVAGGVIGAFASIPWFISDASYKVGSGGAVGPIRVDASVLVGKAVFSGIVVGMAGIIALGGWWQFRSACKTYRTIIELLFAAKNVCVISDAARVRQSLALIEGLLGKPLSVSLA